MHSFYRLVLAIAFVETLSSPPPDEITIHYTLKRALVEGRYFRSGIRVIPSVVQFIWLDSPNVYRTLSCLPHFILFTALHLVYRSLSLVIVLIEQPIELCHDSYSYFLLLPPFF